MKKIILLTLFVASSLCLQTQANLEEKTIKIDQEFIQVDVVYPVLGNQKIDTQIQEYITGVYENFIEEAELTTEDNDSMEYPFHTELDIAYSISNNDEKIVSIVFSNYIYMGGAHGLPSVTTFVFDTQTGKQLKLNNSILKRLSDISHRELKKYFDDNGGSGDDDWLKTGTEADYINYKSFSISLKNGKIQRLTLYFQAYQVAAYAAGMPILVIDRDMGTFVE